jgi:hypothetical protein
MNASPPQPTAAEPFDDYDDGRFDEPSPLRARASYLTPLTALLMALIVGGVGFYVGIRVEKSQTSTTGGTAGSFARAFAGAAGANSASGRTAGGLPSGLSSRLAAGGFGGAGTTGSVSSLDGNTIYVKENGGNTVKVRLSSATKISKTEGVSREKLYPGDTVSVSGSTAPNGTVNATSVTDSGASANSTPAAASGSNATGNSSAVRSLFGGG